MTQIKILSVDMRGKDREIIQTELQEQVDEMNQDGLDVVGPIYPLPSPNTAIQYFVATCRKGLKVSSVKEKIKEVKEVKEPEPESEVKEPEPEAIKVTEPFTEPTIPEWRPDSSDFVN